MTGHLALPAFDPSGRPATLSRRDLDRASCVASWVSRG